MNTLFHTQTVELPGKNYPIHIGSGLIRDCLALREIVTARTAVIVANTKTAALFGSSIRAQIEPVAHRVLTVEMPDGEAFKTLDQLDRVFSTMLEAHADRRSVIIALGGGVVGDMAGFAAATFQRGIDFIQVPTTLLAMVDSSVGGKTAVNHRLGKNMIGAFHQPLMVLADVDTLDTLPDAELTAGLAEVIKHGAVASREYFDSVRESLPKLLAKDKKALAEIVYGSCKIKAAVVSADEKEQGIRAHLNFGHTFGHAIETHAGYGQWLHGRAVGTGMLMAASLSGRLGTLSEGDEALLRSLVLAAGLPPYPPKMSNSEFIELMRVDKKASNGIPKFILLKGLGAAYVDNVDESVLRAVLNEFQGDA